MCNVIKHLLYSHSCFCQLPCWLRLSTASALQLRHSLSTPKNRKMSTANTSTSAFLEDAPAVRFEWAPSCPRNIRDMPCLALVPNWRLLHLKSWTISHNQKGTRKEIKCDQDSEALALLSPPESLKNPTFSSIPRDLAALRAMCMMSCSNSWSEATPQTQ